MNRNRILALSLACSAFIPLLTGCPTDGRRDTFDYLRSPVTFRLDPIPADHPYCLDVNKRLPGTSEQECRDASKYRLRWDRPEDTVGFAEYRIYVDTTPPNSALPWIQIRKTPSLASFILEGSPPAADSIIFVFADSGAVARSLSRALPGVVPLDTSGRLDSGRVVFSIVTAYRESGLDGQPRYTWAITDDRFAPYPLQPRFVPKARSVEIEWERPRDPTSFFEPGADSGIILAYYLRVIRGGLLHANRGDSTFNPTVTYSVGGVDRTAEVVVDTFHTTRAPGALFFLPDSHRVRNRTLPDPLDSLRVTISGLPPQDTVDITLWPVDTAGNVNPNDSSPTNYTRVLLTDSTQPTRPLLRIEDSTRNGFTYAFTESRDRVQAGDSLIPAGQPNANILEYRISRRLLSGSAGGAANRDTIILVSAARRTDTLFRDSARYLPPGSTYRLFLQSVDSTGYLSETDSLTVSTVSSPFPGDDSGFTCPPGFVAAPGGFFLRGDTTTNVATNDEKPLARRYMESFCIEAYEHRDSTGAFKTRATWQQAHDICQDLSESLTPADSTWLCTEAEWERSCEGVEPDAPLLYGNQSEQNASGSVRFTCNIGTGDSAMALSQALRDPKCISYDGVFDLSGNLAEWVLDPLTLQQQDTLVANGYPATPDTLRRGVPHTAINTPGAVRAFRGSHYLNPGQSPATLLRYARCSNRDFATQSRPRPYAGCIDSTQPKITLLYNTAAKPPRCLPVPDSINADNITSLATTPDSSRILILLRNVTTPVSYTIPFDSAYTAVGLRPISAELTPRSLAIVTFVNSETMETITDTLHAAELYNRTEAERTLVFAREASPPWEVTKQGGNYVIRYLYAHIRTRNVVAKSYYSNAALGFRCCSRPRP